MRSVSTMTRSLDHISRRDFLNGVAVTIAATLSPRLSRGAPHGEHFSGSTDESFAIAHAVRDGRAFASKQVALEGELDLVVIGAGISGLASAHVYRKHRPNDRILLLDNHDEFGGHARRCELRVGDRTLITYGGSESLQSPRSLWSEAASMLLRDLGVDLRQLEDAFDITLYSKLGLSRGLLFKREVFGVDKLVRGDPTRGVTESIPAELTHSRDLPAFIGDFPLSRTERNQLLALHTSARDVWPRLGLMEKMAQLSTVSYRDFLKQQWQLSDTALAVFQKRPHDFFGVGIDLLPAHAAAAAGYPGFAGMNLPTHPRDAAKLDDPYIHHFPDGNASIARLLVRSLLPRSASGSTMADIVAAQFDESTFDVQTSPTRLRLNSTVVQLANTHDGVDVSYMHAGVLKRVRAKHAIFAAYNMMLPYVCKEMDERQRKVLSKRTKAPIVYVKVALRNWQSWVDAGVHDVINPTGFYSRIKLDFPVSLGGYTFARTASEPIVVHLVHCPVPANSSDQRTAWREGRRRLYDMTFSTFERNAYDELKRILGVRFEPARDVAAIDVYRWGHGYAYGFNTLFDDDSDELALGRQSIGRIAIANSDAAMSAYAHAAIDAAARAVEDVISQTKA